MTGSRRWKRTEMWVALIVAAVAFVPVALMGLWAFKRVTATVLHPDVNAVPSAGSSTRPDWSSPAEQGRRIVRTALAEQNLPGMSVAVGAGGDIVWAEGFGWADLDGRVPVGAETRFRIGTASTPLTATAVGLLLEMGWIELDDEIQTDVPEFPRKQWPITVRQLLANTAGVANDGGDEGPLFTRHCLRPADAFQFLSGSELELRFEPGTQHRFSSYGGILLSAAVEAAADEPFLAFMQKEVFGPAGMHDTRADSVTEAVAHRATPYFPRFAADPRYGLHLMRPLDLSCYAGAGAFLSTPSDLVRFGLAITGGALLQPATVQLLQTPQRLPSGEETGYGLGWEVGTATLAGRPARWAGHDGTVLGGPVASLLTFPERGLVVAVISNISYANTRDVAMRIADAFAQRQMR